MDTYCLKCGQRYRLGTDHACQPKLAVQKSTAARKDVLSGQPESRANGSKHLVPNDAHKAAPNEAHLPAGTQALPVDTKRKPGRPRTITDMRAYKAQKERDRRAKIKGKME